MIDQFEREIGDLEKEFKSIRNKEEDSLEQGSLQLYHLEEEFNNHIEGETAVRKQEHDTIIRLVAECIEKIRYIY